MIHSWSLKLQFEDLLTEIQVQYDFSSKAPMSHFESITLELFGTSGKIDRELVPSYELEVGAEDELGSLAFSHVLITVTDKNDNSPRFTRLLGISYPLPLFLFFLK